MRASEEGGRVLMRSNGRGEREYKYYKGCAYYSGRMRVFSGARAGD